jgi:hypothetical protein
LFTDSADALKSSVREVLPGPPPLPSVLRGKKNARYGKNHNTKKNTFDSHRILQNNNFVSLG